MKRFLLFCVISFVSLISIALGETIQSIKVVGNERLSREAILQYVSSKPGYELSRDRVRDDLRALYNTGLFKDIQIDAEKAGQGLQLVIRVEEKDYIQGIEFGGNKSVSKEDLEKAISLKPPFLWDEAVVSDAIEKIRKLYRDKGFYLVTLRTDILREDKKKILKFEIDEGEKVEVRRIYFQGNTVFSDEVLKEVMVTKEGGFWSSLSGSGRFDEDVLAQVDARRILLQYWKHGYAFAKVDAPSITFTPDRKYVVVSFHIEEGDQYTVGSISILGDLDFIPDPEEYAKQLDSQSGAVWNYTHIQSDMAKIQELYGNHGYAYANVSPDWRISPTDPHALDISYRIDKGNIVYFGNIDIIGNVETLDRVIRRELEFKEGELFNLTNFRESKANLERLGYFSKVNFIQKDILSENRMDVTIEVEEKQTGSLSLGASFSSFDRFGIQGSVSKINLFGRGYDVSLSGLFSGKRQLFSASFTNPRVMDTRLSLSVTAFNQEYESSDASSFKERGGTITLGYPLNKQWSISGTYSLRDIRININEEILPLYPHSFGLNSSVGFTLTRDTLNTREIFLPSKGSLNQLSTTIASQFFGSDMSYWRSSFVSKRYIQLVRDDAPLLGGSVLTFGLRLDYIIGIEGRSTPFSERFVPGGIYSIRGHLYRSLSPYVYSTFPIAYVSKHLPKTLDATKVEKLRLGGNKQMIFNVEYLFDVFREARIKGVLFFDMGNAFPESDWQWDQIRYSAGFGFRWFSPLGPLRFEWGIPLDRRAGEDQVVFDFSIGAPF